MPLDLRLSRFDHRCMLTKDWIKRCSFGLMHDMNADHRENIKKILQAIASNLLHSWNTLRFLQRLRDYKKSQSETMNSYAHFWTPVSDGIWDQLILPLSHCTDKRREAQGFPKLFKLIKGYAGADNDALCNAVEDHDRKLSTSTVAMNITKLRGCLFAHVTPYGLDRNFLEAHKPTLEDIESHITILDDILSFYSMEVIGSRFSTQAQVSQMQEDLDRVVKATRDALGK